MGVKTPSPKITGWLLKRYTRSVCDAWPAMSRDEKLTLCGLIVNVKTAHLSPVLPPENIFALPAEVFSSCLAIISAVMVGGLFLWPAC